MKLGVIGFGKRFSGIWRNFQTGDPDHSIAGVVDPDPKLQRAHITDEERASLRRFGSMDALIRQGRPDALYIGTRCDMHTPLAMEAAKYNLPIFLEKPVSHSMEQALALEAAFRNSKCPVLVSFPLRASTLCRKTKELLNQGIVGRVEHVLATNYVAYGWGYFYGPYREYSITQGLFLQKATHDLDYLAYLIGTPIVRVAAMHSLGRVYRDSSTPKDLRDPEAIYYDNIGTPETGMNEDSSSALLEFADGTKGVYTQVFFAKGVTRRGAVLSGTKGLLEFDWYQSQIKSTDYEQPIHSVTTIKREEDHWGGDPKLVQNFLNMVQNGAPPLSSIQDGLRSVYACLAAKESASTGHFVPVRQVEDF